MPPGLPRIPGISGAAPALLALGCVLSAGCQRSSESRGPGGELTQQQAGRYLQRAVGRSAEGIVLLPSKKADVLYDRSRLTELAQELRSPAAACFVTRTIETIEIKPPADGSEDPELLGVPDGQIRFRVRLAPDGRVLRTEVLETRFEDDAMEPCLADVLRRGKWPGNTRGNVQFVDVVYWVGLGPQGDMRSASAHEAMRTERAKAGQRVARCLEGRVDAGEYAFEAVMLFDRNGRGLGTKMAPAAVAPIMGRCAFKALELWELPPDPASFVRVRDIGTRVTVNRLGQVQVPDAQWLAARRAEAKAAREAQDAELEARTRRRRAPIRSTAGDASVDDGADDSPGGSASTPSTTGDAGAVTSKPKGSGDAEDGDAVPEVAPKAARDPGAAGVRINLRPRPRG